MSNKTISMNKLRQVLHFYAQGKGTKAISSILGLSRNTVKKYLQHFHGLGLGYESVLSLSDSELSALFFVPVPKPTACKREQELLALLPEYCKRLKRKGVTRDILHKEYKSQYPDGYARSRFQVYIQRYLEESRPIMHIDHKAGDKMYIDFTGDKLSIVSPPDSAASGLVREVEVFVAILGCSQLTYVEAVYSQKKEDLIKACENAIYYFEGVPQAIVPDNLKSAVTKSSKYEAIINDDFASFASHYGTSVIPARAYKPKDKSLVEGAVKLIYRSIYTKIENRIFHELESLNQAIRVALEIHNNTPFSGREYSRREQYEEIERMNMGQLNPIRYQLKGQSIATVMKNGYVRLSVDCHYYSVPYKYIGKKVKILFTSSTIEVFYRYELIAVHSRSQVKYRYTTNSEHLASHHRFPSEWTPEKFINQAAEIHEDVARYISQVIQVKPHPEQAYKSCMGILNLLRRVGSVRLINACRCAESYGQYNYPIIEQILHKRMDELVEEDNGALELPLHDNIRGKDYFQ